MKTDRSYRPRPALPALVAAFFVLGSTPGLGGGVAIVNTVLSDDGDDDGYADTRETVSVRLTVENTSGIDLTDVTAHVTTENPQLVCITDPTIDIGALAAGEVKLTEPFVFSVVDVDRTLEGLGPFDPLTATFGLEISSAPEGQTAYPSKLTLDIDLDVSGGSSPATYLESFEDGLGSFVVENLDADRHSNIGSDGFRCQYHDPDWVNSNVYGTSFGTDCFLGATAPQADAVFWGLSGPETSPLGGRGFSGFHSLFFGIDFGDPLNWSTPMAFLEAVASDPVYLGWDETSPTLSFMHMISLVDGRLILTPPDQSSNVGVVMAQLADENDDPAGDWIKLYPYQNVYDQQAADNYFNCSFDPVDDGNTEDTFFDPTDPNRRLGPSSTCFPEYSFVNLGETSDTFDAANVGKADGPGLQGIWGIGTWIESKFDLSRFRGQRVRLRFLTSGLKAGTIENWQDYGVWNPVAGDDGWWIDDVTVTGALTHAAIVAADAKDNSSLPGIPGGDSDTDGVYDVCDNCADELNADQLDQDLDGLGDACDSCPTDPTNFDPDLDGFCGAEDNCPVIPNPDQIDGDFDGAGVACDCDDGDPGTYPGAAEINDGQDNQCPGDAGYGLVDEISGNAGFHNPDDRNEYSWPVQQGTTRYQVARAGVADYSSCSQLPLTTATFIVDTDEPTTGDVYFYLVRAALPNAGSWGADSSGQERTFFCGF